MNEAEYEIGYLGREIREDAVTHRSKPINETLQIESNILINPHTNEILDTIRN